MKVLTTAVLILLSVASVAARDKQLPMEQYEVTVNSAMNLKDFKIFWEGKIGCPLVVKDPNSKNSVLILQSVKLFRHCPTTEAGQILLGSRRKNSLFLEIDGKRYEWKISATYDPDSYTPKSPETGRPPAL